MPQRIKARNDTAARWTSINPILAKGELGFETDTNKIKFGDGIKQWSLLSYVGGDVAIPGDVLRTTTPGTIMYFPDNSVVGTAFVTAGVYLRTATSWIFPPWLQQQTLERFSITTFPYTLLQADAELGMVYLAPTANAQVNLPSGIAASPVVTGMRSYLDVLFYIDGAFTVTFVPVGTVQLFVPGTQSPVASYSPTAGTRKTVVMQVRSTTYRVLD